MTTEQVMKELEKKGSESIKKIFQNAFAIIVIARTAGI